MRLLAHGPTVVALSAARAHFQFSFRLFAEIALSGKYFSRWASGVKAVQPAILTIVFEPNHVALETVEQTLT